MNIRKSLASAYVAQIMGARFSGAPIEGHQNHDGKLTASGRAVIRVVLTGGVFNIIHPGHVHTLNAAKALGDVLVVVVASDKAAGLKRSKLHPQKQRITMVRSLRMVDVAVHGNPEGIFETVRDVKPDIIALGYDQAHAEDEILEGCRKIDPDIRVVRLGTPHPEMSSRAIEKSGGASGF